MTLIGVRSKNHPQQVAAAGANNDVDDRWTPAEVYDPLAARWGFTLDAAASAANAKTPKFYTLADDGLSRSWGGERVWCNPPYSDLGRWVAKAWEAMLAERAVVVVMLLPANRTEQRWWQDNVEPYRDKILREGVALDVAFLAGRLRFHRPGWVAPKNGNRPPFGCCLLTWSRPTAGGPGA